MKIPCHLYSGKHAQTLKYIHTHTSHTQTHIHTHVTNFASIPWLKKQKNLAGTSTHIQTHTITHTHTHTHTDKQSAPLKARLSRGRQRPEPPSWLAATAITRSWMGGVNECNGTGRCVAGGWVCHWLLTGFVRTIYAVYILFLAGKAPSMWSFTV
jgi:hypothetical protein